MISFMLIWVQFLPILKTFYGPHSSLTQLIKLCAHFETSPSLQPGWKQFLKPGHTLTGGFYRREEVKCPSGSDLPHQRPLLICFQNSLERKVYTPQSTLVDILMQRETWASKLSPPTLQRHSQVLERRLPCNQTVYTQLMNEGVREGTWVLTQAVWSQSSSS